jgi:hypothetical protein
MTEPKARLHDSLVKYIRKWMQYPAGPFWERDVIADIFPVIKNDNAGIEPCFNWSSGRPAFLENWEFCCARSLGCEAYAPGRDGVGNTVRLYSDIYLRKSCDEYEWTLELKIASPAGPGELTRAVFEEKEGLFGRCNVECTFTNHLAHDLWRWRKGNHQNYVFLLGLVNIPAAFRGGKTTQLKPLVDKLESEWGKTLQLIGEIHGDANFDAMFVVKRIGENKVEDAAALATHAITERLTACGIPLRLLPQS